MEPWSAKSSLSTDVITACLIFIKEMDFATFSGSSQSTFSGLPVLTPQNPQDLVQIFPNIINVAVPSPQHSPILGQLPDEQIVFNLYLSTNVLRFVYCLPTGNLTLIHFGFLENFSVEAEPEIFFEEGSFNFFQDVFLSLDISKFELSNLSDIFTDFNT